MNERAIGFIASKDEVDIILEVRGPETTGYVASIRYTGRKRVERSLGYNLKLVEEFVKRSGEYYRTNGFEVMEFVDLCSS